MFLVLFFPSPFFNTPPSPAAVAAEQGLLGQYEAGIWSCDLRANERPGSDHVTWGPMRGLKKLHGMGTSNRQTDTHTDTRTSWLLDQLGQEGRVGENLTFSHHYKIHGFPLYCYSWTTHGREGWVLLLCYLSYYWTQTRSKKHSPLLLAS